MPKKTPRSRSQLAKFVAEHTDPRLLVQKLDDDNAETDLPYNRAYAEERQYFLDIADSAALSAVAARAEYIELEDVARRAGFVVGFEYARALCGAKSGAR